ncbi:DUF4421 domain-containing protein [Chitinophaga horti]|uniref:DUF4421 domain-containing protein n=1 Tax=Chitinophaga horti TaxID=2920382 RepID=A0ABY6IWC5_9BACT|nr:DUF4421 domain-containing protein [Chitinophaga horti]UYQ91501.1 DUF4421 domain-containing protein [Chitinophaga horti]
MRKILLLFTFLCYVICSTQAQRKESFLKRALRTNNDTIYVQQYLTDVTFRMLGQRKYSYYDLNDRGERRELLYRPNNRFTVGIGANYEILGLNLVFNVPFLNRDESLGKTKFLDLQTHFYLRKFAIDLFGNYYKGFYIANPRSFIPGYQPGDGFPKRSDLYHTNFGLQVQYIFNDTRFSYRAAFVQNEWQKRSAGSLIAGGEAYRMEVRSDSNLVPTGNPEFFDGSTFSKSSIFTVVGNIGYAYTFVYRKHFYATGALSAGLGINSTAMRFQEGHNKLQEIGWQFNNTVRLSAGYNSAKYFAGVHYVEVITRGQSPVARTYQTFGAGTFRVSVGRRFGLKKPWIKPGSLLSTVKKD